MSEPSRNDADPIEVAAAEDTDRAIDALLAGRADDDADPTLLWLAASVRVDVPASLAPRVARDGRADRARRARPARIAAAVLAYLFLSHGLGNFFVGGWVADNLGQAQSPHALTEGSLALIAVGLVVTMGALWPRWLTSAAVAGVPLALAFGVIGLTEAPTFGAGAALHLSQAAAGVALALSLRRLRPPAGGRRKFRDAVGDRDEASSE